MMWMGGCRVYPSKLTDRKQRLLACACVRRVWALLAAPELRAVISDAEAFADGWRTIAELKASYTAARLVSEALPRHSPMSLAAWAATRTATHAQYCNRPFDHRETLHLSQIVTEALIPGEGPNDPQVRDVRQVEADIHQSFLVDIEPPPETGFSPEWRNALVVSLAQHIYESWDFAAMPILADALQDTGCDNEAILDHCQGAGSHVRGCWALDLLLAKE
jgi:hypothetical protein